MSQKHLTSKRRASRISAWHFSVVRQHSQKFLPQPSTAEKKMVPSSESKIRECEVVQDLKQAVFPAHAHVLWQGDANSLHSLGLFALCRKSERTTSKVPQSRHVAKNDYVRVRRSLGCFRADTHFISFHLYTPHFSPQFSTLVYSQLIKTITYVFVAYYLVK